MNIIKISWGILFLFSLFGMLILQVGVHEYVHKYDYREMEKTDLGICVFNIPNEFSWDMALGYYDFTIPATRESIKQEEKIGKYTEYKAYAASAMIITIFFIALYVVTFKWRKEDER